MKKTHIAALAVALAFVPALASAQMSTSTQAQVDSLLGQIKALQAQLRTLLASSTPFMKKQDLPPGQMGKIACIEFNRDLRVGALGEDVKKLQEILAEDPAFEFRGKPTGFFGPLTANALAKFQM